LGLKNLETLTLKGIIGIIWLLLYFPEKLRSVRRQRESGAGFQVR